MHGRGQGPGGCASRRAYRGSFEQTRTLAGSELAVKSQGRFWQDCTLGLVWQVNKPRQESRVYTRSQNDLLISQTGSVKALNGAYVRLDTPSDTLSIQLADFAEHDGAQGVCREWLDDQNDVCRALSSPRQRLEATGDN